MSQDIFDAVDEAASLTPAPCVDTNSQSLLPTTSQTNTNTYRPHSPQYSEPVNRSVSSINDANAGEWERLLYVASQVSEREPTLAPTALEEEETAPLLLNEISPSQSSLQRTTIITEFRVESDVDNLVTTFFNIVFLTTFFH